MSTAALHPLDYDSRPAVNPWIVALTVSMATFMEVLDTSIANVSLKNIAGNLGAGNDESTWVLTSYLVANAVVLPISGWLASVFGRKRFYMTCVALFTISSLLCGFAPSLGWLLFFRVLQGFGGGGLAPSEQSILADTFAPSQRGMAFAVYGVAVVVAPAIGPTLGGWITDNYSWRWIFFINIPVGILSLFLTYHLVRDSAGAKMEHKAAWKNGLHIDYIGFALVTLGIGALQVILDKGQEDDWFSSNFIRIFATLAVLGILSAIIWELFYAKTPVVDLGLLKDRSFLFMNILMFCVGFVLTSTTVMIPQFVQDLLGYNATNAGLILMPGGFSLMIMMPVAGILVKRVQPKYMMAAGLLITSAAMYYLAGFNTTVPFWHLAWARVFQAIGLPPGKSNNASALLNLMRNLGGGIGISIAVTILARRTQFHQNRLGSHFTMFDTPFREQLSAMISRFTADGSALGEATTRAMSVMYRSLQAQALMLSYLDVFKIMAVGCLCVVVLVLFVKRVDPHAKVEAVGH
jgi:DHA2 family multidrug resistance protein